MSTTLSPTTKSETADHDPEQLPDASVLEDKTPEWCRVPAVVTPFVIVLGILLITLFANRPLWPTDLWDHINYGQTILTERSIPDTEPLIPLATGVRMVNFAWLSQVGLAVIFESGGTAALQFLYGMLIVLSLGAVGYSATRRSSSAVFGLMACGVMLIMSWEQFRVVRPQLFGLLFYCILLAVLLRRSPIRKAIWLLMPAMFAVWANCHGSFAVGLLVMGLMTAGRFVSMLRSTRSPVAALRAPSVLQQLLLFQLCAAAVLLNPNGLEIYHAAATVGSHPNISSMFEWDPLTLRMRQGQLAAVCVVMLLGVLRVSPRRVRADEILVILATGCLALWSARMITWWAPVVGIAFGTHAAAAWRQYAGTHRRTEPWARTGLYTIINLGLCWVFFALTSLGVQAVHGSTPEDGKRLNEETPFELVNFLNTMEEFPTGVAFVRAEWAGYVMKFGPNAVKPMVNLHVHLMPEEVWRDYVRIQRGPTDTDGLLDRYGINLVIVDVEHNKSMVDFLRQTGDWESLYEDARGIVMRRIVPID